MTKNVVSCNLRNTVKGPESCLQGYHSQLSQVHFDLSNLSDAKLHGQQALNLAQTNHEKSCEGASWIQLGRTIGKTDKSQIDEAEKYILKGLKILDELRLKPRYASG